jgi:hypothetical protein
MVRRNKFPANFAEKFLPSVMSKNLLINSLYDFFSWFFLFDGSVCGKLYFWWLGFSAGKLRIEMKIPQILSVMP